MIIGKYVYNLATDKYRGFIFLPIKALLWVLSIIYGLIIRILIFLYLIKPCRLNCKVISIGNITLGGTGKTSLVEYIARYLKQEGHKVAILSRGYGRQSRKNQIRNTAYEAMGDEPYMLSKNLGDIPVIVNKDRIKAAKQAIKEYGVDTVILDDGFQQWKIKKDLEVVTIDATCPWGNQHLIPRGILREPLSSLKRADIVFLTKTNLNPDLQDIEDFLSRVNPSLPIIESIHMPLGFYKVDHPDEFLNIDILKAKTVTLISGIADPDSFENLIMSLGINIGLSFRFPDHYGYLKRDLENIFKESQQKNIDNIVTTEKDAARLSHTLYPILGVSIWVLRIELRITKYEQGFHNRLLRLYSL